MDVYRILHSDSGKCYVGSTIRSTERRFREHCSNAMRGGNKSLLYDAIREYGVSAFAVETIATAALYEELLTLERDAIAANNCVVPHGFNVVAGGRGNYGWKMSDVTRARIAAKAAGRPAHNKGIKASAETRAKARASQLLRLKREQQEGRARVAWNKGIPSSEHTRKKQSLAKKGRPLSVAHRLALTGLKRSSEQCANIARNKRQWWAKQKANQNTMLTQASFEF